MLTGGHEWLHWQLEMALETNESPQENLVTDAVRILPSMGWATSRNVIAKARKLLVYSSISCLSYPPWDSAFQIWVISSETPPSLCVLQSCFFGSRPGVPLPITWPCEEKGLSITFPHQKDRGQREQCNCTASREIGQYEHFVRYTDAIQSKYVASKPLNFIVNEGDPGFEK